MSVPEPLLRAVADAIEAECPEGKTYSPMVLADVALAALRGTSRGGGNLGDLLLAAQALAKLVKEEYPADCTLSYIAQTWGRGALTDEECSALDRWSGVLS